MLVDANTGAEVTHLPDRAQGELDEVLARLQPEQVAAMENQIEQWADAIGDERTDFFASNWLTGNDWKQIANGVFEPLYEACVDSSPASTLRGGSAVPCNEIKPHPCRMFVEFPV